jgi:hypothetical protein
MWAESSSSIRGKMNSLLPEASAIAAGVEQQATIPWQTYQDRRGSVIYGGRSLGRAPKRSGGGWASGSVSGWRAARTG